MDDYPMVYLKNDGSIHVLDLKPDAPLFTVALAQDGSVVRLLRDGVEMDEAYIRRIFPDGKA